MTDEEIQRAIEFIIQQQAKYAARLEKDEPRLARLEESFKMLVELARGTDERLDTMGETMATLSHTMNELVQSMITLAEAQRQADARVTDLARDTDERSGQDAARFERDESRLARLEESFTMLVELARGADERQDTMDETMATLSHTMNELVQRTITDESRLARLEESFTMLVELAHRHE